MAKKFVSWRRVSTFKQGQSGLGLEAQKDIIDYFVKREGGYIIEDYAECYTGTELSGCVELKRAIAHAKKEGATLIIAKSDRFRNTIEALKIYEEMGDGNIMFCDLPHTDKFTLTLFFALAEREALLVSIRTKQALAAKKARGEKTGGACEKWRESYNRKSQEQLKEENMKRGRLKNERFLQSKETQVFMKILSNVFPSACSDENPSNWDWGCINTKNGAKDRILSLMKDYRYMDDSLFANFDFDDIGTKVQTKLCVKIQNLRTSVRTNVKIKEEIENEY